MFFKVTCPTLMVNIIKNILIFPKKLTWMSKWKQASLSSGATVKRLKHFTTNENSLMKNKWLRKYSPPLNQDLCVCMGLVQACTSGHWNFIDHDVINYRNEKKRFSRGQIFFFYSHCSDGQYTVIERERKKKAIKCIALNAITLSPNHLYLNWPRFLTLNVQFKTP